MCHAGLLHEGELRDDERYELFVMSVISVMAVVTAVGGVAKWI